MAKAASKRPPVKAKSARPSKPAAKAPTHSPVAKAPSKLLKAAVKAAPAKSLVKSSVAKASPAKVVEKPTARANGTPVSKGKSNRPQDARPKLGSVPGRMTPPLKAARPLANSEPIEPPVPTNNKPRKNQAGLNSRELEHFRELLLAKRGEIVGDMSAMEREALRTSGGSNLSTLPIHMADMGTDNYEQEFTLGLVETERKLLREINHALSKIQNGSYGICEGTGKPIAKARLEVQPWARYSIEYAKKMERGGR